MVAPGQLSRVGLEYPVVVTAGGKIKEGHTKMMVRPRLSKLMFVNNLPAQWCS